MRKLLKLEELAQFALAMFLIGKLNLSVNYLCIFYFFLPDVFALGYFINRKVGASLYNFSHHKWVSIMLISLGMIGTNQFPLLIGLLTYAHSSFDRALGYGLKYIGSPDHTHLGFIGKQKHQNPPDHF